MRDCADPFRMCRSCAPGGANPPGLAVSAGCGMIIGEGSISHGR